MLNKISNNIFLFLLFPFFSLGQEAVKLTCIEVLADGLVTIRWTPPVNSTGFDRYEIYFSANGTSFTKIDEINTALQNQYTDINANAGQGTRFYYVNSVYADGEAASEIIQSIFLELDNNAPEYNRADLYWNAISNPLPNGSTGIYKIYEEYPLGNWFERSTSTSLTESLDVIVCIDSISFKIEMENSSGCTSVSNIAGAIFKDALYPVKPEFDSVSINNSGEVILGWQPSVDGDVEGYIVYRLENQAWIEIQRVDGHNSASYTDMTVDPCTDIFTYAIAAFDSCGNKSPGTFSEPLSNILLENVVFDVCSMTNTISWSPYINAQPVLDGYKIFCSEDGSAFFEVGFVEVGQTEYVHTGLIAGVNYNYRVQAVYGNRSSSSCAKSVKTYSFLQPQFVYLANASVLPSNEIELTAEVDTLVNACNWEIWGSNEDNTSPILLTSIPKNELSDFPLSYTDVSADGSQAWYEYYLVVIDSCGDETRVSNTLKTIRLEGSQPSKEQNQLNWNAFEGWEEGVEKYYIFRMTSDEIPILPYDSVGPTTLTYTDNFSGDESQDGIFAYWVQAKQNDGNTYGYIELSNSNLIYLAEETNLYMPNAFKPVGDNEFMPVFKYFTGSNYLFQIYNRWGQLIFETQNPNEGWTGKYNDENVPLGVYAYRVVYSNLENQTVQLQGTVTVVR